MRLAERSVTFTLPRPDFEVDFFVPETRSFVVSMLRAFVGGTVLTVQVTARRLLASLQVPRTTSELPVGCWAPGLPGGPGVPGVPGVFGSVVLCAAETTTSSEVASPVPAELVA